MCFGGISIAEWKINNIDLCDIDFCENEPRFMPVRNFHLNLILSIADDKNE